MRFITILCCLFILGCTTQKTPAGRTLTPSISNEVAEDYRLVYAAINDYVDALYLVEPERITKSVDPELRKIGYYYNDEQEGYVNNVPMTYKQLFDLAASWNQSGEQANEASVKKIKVFEVNDKTASGKLTAAWGIDYFHLAKVDGTWKIVNVMWQSEPR